MSSPNESGSNALGDGGDNRTFAPHLFLYSTSTFPAAQFPVVVSRSMENMWHGHRARKLVVDVLNLIWYRYRWWSYAETDPIRSVDVGYTLYAASIDQQSAYFVMHFMCLRLTTQLAALLTRPQSIVWLDMLMVLYGRYTNGMMMGGSMCI